MKINISNYEEYLLSYVDGELSPEDASGVRAFLAAHPELQAELKLLESTVLKPHDQISFPDKQSLYRKESSGGTRLRVLRYPWIAAASAACILLIAGFFFWSRTGTPPGGKVAAGVTEKQPAIAPAGRPQNSSVHNTNLPGPVPEEKTLTAARPDRPVRHTPLVKVPDSRRPALAENRKPAAADKPVIPPLPVPGKLTPVTTGPVLPVTPEEPVFAQVSPPAKMPEGEPLKTGQQVNGKESPEGKLVAAVETLDDTKRNINDAITRKLAELNDKKSGLMDQVGKKGIRIGHVTFALNY